MNEGRENEREREKHLPQNVTQPKKLTRKSHKQHNKSAAIKPSANETNAFKLLRNEEVKRKITGIFQRQATAQHQNITFDEE